MRTKRRAGGRGAVTEGRGRLLAVLQKLLSVTSSVAFKLL